MNPDASGAPVARHHLEVRCITDTEHEWMGAHAEWNEGKNDGFVKANAGAADDPSGSRAMGYYDARELPTLHALAGAYATSDRHFSSLLGPTLPNRMFLFAGTSFGVSRGRIIGDRQPNLFDAMDAAGVDWAEYHEISSPRRSCSRPSSGTTRRRTIQGSISSSRMRRAGR